MIKGEYGFTILEIVIVIIIVGVLASLALPRFYSTIEFSKSTEAIVAISAIRHSIERCYTQTKDYSVCNLNKAALPDNLDIEDPGNAPGNHFTYTVESGPPVGQIKIIAARNTRDEGTDGDTVEFTYQSGELISRGGTGAFDSIN